MSTPEQNAAWKRNTEKSNKQYNEKAKIVEGLYLEIQEAKTNKLLEDWNEKGETSNADKVIMLILENQLGLMKKMAEMCTKLDVELTRLKTE